MKINCFVIILLFLSNVTMAEVLYKSTTDIYNLKLNQEDLLESKIHDYINNISQYCKIKPLDSKYWGIGTFRVPDMDDKFKESCESLKQNQIEFTCHQHGLLLTDHYKRPKGIASFYPVTSEKNIKDGTDFRGIVKCYLNKTFKKNNISTNLMVKYKLEKRTDFSYMSDPRDRSKKIKIIESAKLLPNIKELKPRYEIIIIP